MTVRTATASAKARDAPGDAGDIRSAAQLATTMTALAQISRSCCQSAPKTGAPTRGPTMAAAVTSTGAWLNRQGVSPRPPTRTGAA